MDPFSWTGYGPKKWAMRYCITNFRVGGGPVSEIKVDAGLRRHLDVNMTWAGELTSWMLPPYRTLPSADSLLTDSV